MSECPEVVVLEVRGWTPQVTAHVAACGSCKLVMELIEERSQAAASRDRRVECAKFEALIAVRVAGGIGTTAAGLLDEHLEDCDECRAIAETMAPANDRTGDQTALATIERSAYALGAEVARGGMGRIVSARDLRIGRPVAVKELLSNTSTQAARFEREARVTARLQHPGIVPIYEIGRWANGTPFYSMRMVAGRTLRAELADRKTVAARLALLPAVITASEAVAFAHANCVIHRDLTPSNIMVGEYGETVVIDWGLAKDLADETATDEAGDGGPYRVDPRLADDLTVDGAVIGTASYMPPEQAAGDRVDARADVYALGAILYHVLVGHAPYRGRNDAVLTAVKAGPPPALTTDAPRDLVSIVEKAMARDPADRYPSARELVAELTAFQAGRLVESHTYSRGELVRRWVRRWRGVVTVGAIATIILAVGGALALHNVLDERDRAEAGEREALAARSVAEAERKAGHALTVTLTAEQGRQELLADHPLRALPFLSAAYSDGDTSAETRFMIAAAMHELDSDDLVLHGGTAPAKGLELSRDGMRLLVLRGGLIETWDLTRGLATASLRAPDAHLTGARFSPEGTRIVAWDGSGPRLYVFDVASSALHVLDGHTKPILGARFSADGVVSVASDATWRRWDLATGTSRAFATRPPTFGDSGPAGFGAPEIDRAGKRLVTLAVDGTAEVWDIARGARIAQVGSKAGYGTALSPDGKRVLTWNLDTVTAWSVDTGERIGTARGPGFHIMRCAFRRDGEEAFIAGDNGTVELWSNDLATRIGSLANASGMIYPVWAGLRRILVTAMFWPGIRVWDADLETEIATYDSAGEGSAASDDGNRLAIAEPGGVVRVVSLDRTRLRRRFYAPGTAGNTTSPDGSRIAVVDARGDVTLRDLDRDGVTLHHIPLRKPIDMSSTRAAAVTPEGDVVVLDNTSGALIRRWAHSATPPIAVELTADGRRLLVVEKEASSVRDVDSGDVIARVAVSSSMAHISPDGRRVLALHAPTELAVWDVVAGRAGVTIRLPGPPLFDLFFTAFDGARVAMPCATGDFVTLVLYDTATGRQLAALKNNVIPSFAPTVDRMISAGLDGVLHVTRTRDGAEIAKLPIEASFGLAQITADGTRMAVTKVDGIAEIRSLVDGRALYRYPMRAPVPDLDIAKRSFGYNFGMGNPSIPVDSVFLTGNEGSALAVWDIHLETRTPAEIAKIVAVRVPWRLDGGRLVPATVATPTDNATANASACSITIRYVGLGTQAWLRGDFAPDGWDVGLPMIKTATGFERTLTVADQQQVEYRFVVDGTSAPDRANPRTTSDGHGGVNSVLLVDCAKQPGTP